MAGDALGYFQQSIGLIEDYVAGKLEETTKGAALFSRCGSAPLFHALQFRVPLPTWVSVDTTPNIYGLAEMKDTYHRYIVPVATEDKARIVEVNLGAVTRQLWVERLVSERGYSHLLLAAPPQVVARVRKARDRLGGRCTAAVS